MINLYTVSLLYDLARADEAQVTFTAFPLSFPCDAHIPHLSSLVRQSDLCSRQVHT